jgi:glycosyltransferase involved in cell wall biosynthesis
MGVWNGAPQVREAVTSVLSQTMAELELIVIDDESSDATPAILESFRDPRLRVARRTRSGLTSALNAALGLARAPLVARLDADDVALPESLDRRLVSRGTRTSGCSARPRGRSTPPGARSRSCALQRATRRSGARSSAATRSCTPRS